MEKEIIIVGNAVMDVLARPVPSELLSQPSTPVEDIGIRFGGDALNEAVALSRLGKSSAIITKLGRDETGARILSHLQARHIDTQGVTQEEGLATSVNIVLVTAAGERHFLTNPQGSQRKLTLSQILPHLQRKNAIVSLGSMFVSPLLGIDDMTALFRYAKEELGCIVTADMTTPKRGETLDDLRGLLPYLDYIFPNELEASRLTGEHDPAVNARLLTEAGAGCAVIKCGKAGCIICQNGTLTRLPAYPTQRCIDTTGAGDSFTAGFLYGLSKGWNTLDCGRFACAMGSCAVEALGATEGIAGLEQVMERFETLCAHAVSQQLKKNQRL